MPAVALRYRALARTLAGLLTLTLVLPSAGAEGETGAATRTEIATTAPALTVLDASEQDRARQWGLSDGEWMRYRALLRGLRGSVSTPAISPLEVLGIHARDEAERRDYAERWARAMHEDTDRILAFQRAYWQAFQRLYPREPLLDSALLAMLRPPTASTPAPTAADRIGVFAPLDCPSCAPLIPKLLARAQVGTGIDFYLVGAPAGAEGDRAIRAWAQRHAIPRSAVQTRQITLNHDDGLARRWGQTVTTAPVLVRRHPDGQTVPLAVEALDP